MVSMYHTSVAVPAAAAAGALPFTGLNLAWIIIVAFALLMAAGALWRLVPRHQA